MRGDTVVRDAGDVVEVSEPLTDTAIVTVVTSETIDPATCRIIATADGRPFAVEAPPPPPPPPPPEPTPEPAPPPALFRDNFATGNLSHTENGVSWLVDGGQMPVEPFQTGNALAFHFRTDQSGDSWGEQRFLLGAQYPELWFRRRIFVPTNYFHRNDVGTDNNKFFMLWSNNYSGDLHMGFNTVCSAIAGESDLVVVWKRNGTPQSSDGLPQAARFISAADYGAEMNVVVRCKVDSGAGDGALEVWKNNTKVLSIVNWACFSNVGNFFNNGYLWGYWNSGVNEEIIIRENLFEIATSNIFGVV